MSDPTSSKTTRDRRLPRLVRALAAPLILLLALANAPAPAGASHACSHASPVSGDGYVSTYLQEGMQDWFVHTSSGTLAEYNLRGQGQDLDLWVYAGSCLTLRCVSITFGPDDERCRVPTEPGETVYIMVNAVWQSGGYLLYFNDQARILVPSCSDGVDNEGDGYADYPFDRDCTTPFDDTEETRSLAQCADGIDNDNDGFTDGDSGFFYDDPDCTDAQDDSEATLLVPQCANGFDDDGDGWTDWPSETDCDGPTDDSENWSYWAACSDGFDNDLDGGADYPADEDCWGPQDGSEKAPLPEPIPECSDTFDNDGDGLVDWVYDIDCSGPWDPSEGGDAVACTDGIDNDGDGWIDWPADPGCDYIYDDNENNDYTCSDGIDNDNDGATDWPNDPGCDGPTDLYEY